MTEAGQYVDGKWVTDIHHDNSAADTESLRAALKLAAIIIETKAPTTIEGVLHEPWDELLEHIEATLAGKPIKPRLEVLRRAFNRA